MADNTIERKNNNSKGGILYRSLAHKAFNDIKRADANINLYSRFLG